jgi:preprotein translocase subunit YajC
MELLFPLLLVALLVPMFLGVRRQKRDAAKVTDMQETLKIGDQVTTTSGLYGTVVDLDDTTIDLEIAEDVVTTWLRAAVREVRTEEAIAEDEVTEETGSEETGPEEIGSEEIGSEAIGTEKTATEVTEAGQLEESAAQTETRLTKD